MHFASSVNGVVLGREAVSMNTGPLYPADFAHIAESAQSALILFEFGIGEVAQPEVLPPPRLFLPAMPLQHLGEEPAPVLFVRPFVLVRRQTGQELSLESAGKRELLRQ